MERERDRLDRDDLAADVDGPKNRQRAAETPGHSSPTDQTAGPSDRSVVPQDHATPADGTPESAAQRESEVRAKELLAHTKKRSMRWKSCQRLFGRKRERTDSSRRALVSSSAGAVPRALHKLAEPPLTTKTRFTRTNPRTPCSSPYEPPPCCAASSCRMAEMSARSLNILRASSMSCATAPLTTR